MIFRFSLFLLLVPLTSVSQNLKEKLPNVLFEHLRINVADKEATAKWYVENVGLEIIPSSNKEVVYVAHTGRNMSLELLGKPEVPMILAQMKHDEIHIACTTNEPEKLAKRMVYGGAKIVTPVRKDSNGDIIIDLVDPYNFPIRLIKRAKQVLVK